MGAWADVSLTTTAIQSTAQPDLHSSAGSPARPPPLSPALPPRPGAWLQLVCTSTLSGGGWVTWYLHEPRAGVTWLAEPRRAYSAEGDSVGPISESAPSDMDDDSPAQDTDSAEGPEGAAGAPRQHEEPERID